MRAGRMRACARREPARDRGREARAGMLGAVLGALTVYFLEPGRGRTHRHQLHDRSGATVRRSRRRTAHALRVRAVRTRGRARGLAHRLHPGPEVELDDATLAHKVESIVFRDPAIDKGRINVNAERGEVYLRGELDSPELVARLVEAVRGVPGVRGVTSMLHVAA